jgi:hypothetical protein
MGAIYYRCNDHPTDCWGRYPLARSAWGADFYLCCPGPSLAAVDASALQGPGRTIVAMNTAYPKVRPDLWIGTDPPGSFARTLFWESFLKFTDIRNAQSRVGNLPLALAPHTVFCHLDDGVDLRNLYLDLSSGGTLVWNRNTFWTALHLLFKLGATRIHLVGVDLSNAKQDYHDGRVLPAALKESNQRLYVGISDALPEIAAEVKARFSCSLVSCTAGSPLNRFLPYLPLTEALAASAARAPQDDGPPLYSLHAVACEWNRRLVAPRGIVVSVHDGQADLLEPWWAWYGRHNPYPVLFAALEGVKPETQAWCRQRGLFADVSQPGVHGWFTKPLAILGAPFATIGYLDLDTEVKGDLGPLFAAAEAGKAVVVQEGVDEEKRPMLQAGVIFCQNGDPLVKAWAERCCTESSSWWSDQPILSDMASQPQWSGRIEHPPLEYVRWRLIGDGPCLLMHWHGCGKDEMRRHWAVEQAEAARARQVPA